PTTLAPLPRAVFAALFAVNGFLALMLQLAWVRLFGLVLGSSVYSFAAVLGVYLLGIALGSAFIARPLARGAVSPWWFALLQLALALTALLGSFAHGSLPLAVLELGESTGAAYAVNTLGTIAGSLITGFLLLPALGVEGVVRLAAALAALSGLVALVLPGGAPRTRGVV